MPAISSSHTSRSFSFLRRSWTARLTVRVYRRIGIDFWALTGKFEAVPASYSRRMSAIKGSGNRTTE
jgi:hypothetical protein